jgi:glycosyltransferase involved in cell wall biosynthesis
MDKPLVSVVIPTYTAPFAKLQPEEKLSYCLGTFFQQPHRPIEVIIVDDGTPPGPAAELRSTIEQVVKLLGEGQTLKIFHKENGGQASAFNFGNKLAAGKYIMPFNDDDIVCARFIERAVEYMEGHPDVGFVYGDYMHTTDGREFLRALPPPIPWNPAGLAEIQICPVIGLYRADVVAKTHWDETLNHQEDWDYLIRISKLTKAKYLPLTYSFVIFQHAEQKSMTDVAGVNRCEEIIKKRLVEGYYD